MNVHPNGVGPVLPSRPHIKDQPFTPSWDTKCLYRQVSPICPLKFWCRSNYWRGEDLYQLGDDLARRAGGGYRPTSPPGALHQFVQPRRTLAQCLYQSMFSICPRTKGVAVQTCYVESRDEHRHHFRTARFDLNDLIIIVDEYLELAQIIASQYTVDI